MRLHFIGVGEGVTSALALALYEKGYTVTGSDDRIPPELRTRMEAAGLQVSGEGWSPEKIHSGLDGVILGSGVQAGNPELQQAEEAGVRVYTFPEYLYEYSRHKTRVVISGNYGRAAIISVILHVLDYHDKAVDYVTDRAIGEGENRACLAKNSEFILIEGNEQASSQTDHTPRFHRYKPNIALISNIDSGKEGGYEDDEAYTTRFRAFTDLIVKGGIVVFNEADNRVKAMVEASENPIRKHPYGLPEYEEQGNDILLDTPEGPMPLELPDKEMLAHLSGAKWICQHMGIDEDDFYEAIAMLGN